MTAAGAHLRYERKFVPDGLSLAEVAALVRRHPALFRETYPERPVNNLYLDTPGLRHYHEHINGAAHRLKVRLRWYGALCGRVEQPVLEIKIRHGLLSRKETYPLPAFTVSADFAGSTAALIAADGTLPGAVRPCLRGLEPALTNRYQRRYFCSGDGAIRLTLDSALQFFAPRNHNGSPPAFPHRGPGVILELKYGDLHAEQAARIANVFPFRLTRCSKYVLGVECVNGA